MLKLLSGSAQLIEMELQENGSSNPLVIGPSEPGWPAALRKVLPSCTFLYNDFSIYCSDTNQLKTNPAANIKLLFSDSDTPDPATHDRVIVVLPKGKDAMRAEFSRAAQFVHPEGQVWVVGPNKGGIRSAKPLIEQSLGPIARSSAARHAKLHEVWEIRPGDFYEDLRTFELEAFGEQLKICSLPGVFSHGRLDVGSAFLLSHLAPPQFLRALDMGCGYGVLGTALQRAQPQAHVDFVDCSAPALAATRKTLEANNLSPDRVWASDLFSHVDTRYDLIISNPPFHQGHRTDFDITKRLIEKAQNHLKPSGRLVLVANRFIDYFCALRPLYNHVDVLAENTRFRIIEAHNRAT